MTVASEFRKLCLYALPFCIQACAAAEPVIPLRTLIQLLDAPHHQLAAVAHSFHLTTKSDEIIDEDLGTIETCYRQSIGSRVALCKMSRLETIGKSASDAKRNPMAFLFVRGEDANTREYSREVEQDRCKQHHTEEIASGTSTECITGNLKITLQKRISQQSEVRYQIYVEHR